MQPAVLGSVEDPSSSLRSSPRVAKCVARPGVASRRLCTCSTTCDNEQATAADDIQCWRANDGVTPRPVTSATDRGSHNHKAGGYKLYGCAWLAAWEASMSCGV